MSWRRLAPELLFWALLAAVVVAQLLVVIPGIMVMRLWEDEAFNLTVPVNLLAGLGYTSDGTLSGSHLTPFDPRISTGPIVLLPIAAVLGLGGDLVYGARAVMLAFYALLLAGLWVVGRSIGRAHGSERTGRWAALAAVTVPLGLNTWDSGSPIQSPVDVLGEVPTAALLVWALYFALSKPWLAGLFVGLAMQAKTIGGLGAPAVALAVFMSVPGTFWARMWQVVRCGLFALIPLIVFEVWKLIELGLSGYLHVTRVFAGFLISGGQHVDPVAPGDKLNALLGSWFAPLPLVLVLVALALAVGVLAWFGWRTSPQDLVSSGGSQGSGTGALLAASLLGLASWAGWWMLATHTPIWIRHPTPGLFAFLPLFAAFLVLGIAWLWRAGLDCAGPERAELESAAPDARVSVNSRTAVVARRGTAVAASIVLFLTLAMNVQGHLNIADQARYGEPLAAQREAAAQIAELGETTLASWWGPEVSISVLAGAHAAMSDAPDFLETTRVLRNYDFTEVGLKAFNDSLEVTCREVPVRVGAYAVCVPF